MTILIEDEPTFSTYGYPSLYQKVVNELVAPIIKKHSWIENITGYLRLNAVVFNLLISLLIGISIVIQPSSSLITAIEGFYLLSAGVLLNLFTAKFIEIAYFGLFDPYSNVNSLTVKLVTIVPSPHRNQNGLTWHELNQLKGIAKVEQNSADWRGNFTSLVIIASFLFFFGVADFSLLFEWGNNIFLQSTLPTNHIDLPIPLAWMIIALIWILFFFVGKLVQNVGESFLNYSATYLGAESANRAILFACEEASENLSLCKMKDKVNLTFNDRKVLARKLGYAFVKHEQPFFAEGTLGSVKEHGVNKILISNADLIKFLEDKKN